MNALEGNLIHLAQAGHFDLIVHGCNCFCDMKGGIAASIKEVFPEAYRADCKTAYGDPNKLGSYSEAFIAMKTHAVTVINAYTQFDYRGDGPHVDYEAVRRAFRAIKKDFSGAVIGYPQIGAGLAGGDWARISAIIEEELAGEDHTVVLFRPPTSKAA